VHTSVGAASEVCPELASGQACESLLEGALDGRLAGLKL
jgi:hypothetical protein